jgi:hypothetical protein
MEEIKTMKKIKIIGLILFSCLFLIACSSDIEKIEVHDPYGNIEKGFINKNKQKIGKWTLYSKDTGNEVAKFSYKNDILNGKCLLYDEGTGLTIEIKFKNDQISEYSKCYIKDAKGVISNLKIGTTGNTNISQINKESKSLFDLGKGILKNGNFRENLISFYANGNKQIEGSLIDVEKKKVAKIEDNNNKPIGIPDKKAETNVKDKKVKTEVNSKNDKPIDTSTDKVETNIKEEKVKAEVNSKNEAQERPAIEKASSIQTKYNVMRTNTGQINNLLSQNMSTPIVRDFIIKLVKVSDGIPYYNYKGKRNEIVIFNSNKLGFIYETNQATSLYELPSEKLIDTIKKGEQINSANTNINTDSVQQSSDDYIFPSNRKYISESQLQHYSKDEVALIRNEIYARHGYVFKRKDYQNYFASKPWYKVNSKFSENLFNVIEKENIKIIRAYEKYMGW